MLVGTKCLRCIALSFPIPSGTLLQIPPQRRLFSTSPNEDDNQSYDYRRRLVASRLQSPYITPQIDSTSLRMALDSLADDILTLSHVISQRTAELHLLLNRKSDLCQKYNRTAEKDNKAVLLSEINSVNTSIKALERKLLYARERRIPLSYFVRLRRLHGHLPYPRPRRPNRKDDQSTLVRRSHSTLIGLLSLPAPNVLQELAHFLLTTSLPITETSFLIMIQKLSALRYGSAARSAYHSLIVAGYSPTSPRAVSLMLKLMPAIRDRKEFARLQSLLEASNVHHDVYIHTQLIVGNLKMGSPIRALQQFRAMIANGFQPTLQALTALLHDCGSRRDWQLGVEVWRSLGLGHANLRFRIDLWAYQEMWRLCRKCGQQTSARQILRAARKEGFRVEDLIHTRGRKTKSLPIRSTNKMPELGDLKNSLKQASVRVDDFTRQVVPDGVILPSRVWQNSKHAPGPIQKTSSHVPDMPSSPYREAVERMILAKNRKSNPTISSSWTEASTTAIPLSHNHHSPSSPRRGWDEHVSDILIEASETPPSKWSILSTTKIHTLKSRLHLKLDRTSPPTPVDFSNALIRSHQSDRHPLTFSLPTETNNMTAPHDGKECLPLRMSLDMSVSRAVRSKGC